MQSMSTFSLIWIDSRALFWILILIVRHCDSRGVLTIRLLHYQNDYGQTFDGNCCDHRPSLKVVQPQNCGVQCDYVLRLLITGLGRANEHVFRFRRPIKYNANNIKFEDSTAELTIPFSSWPGEAGLLVFFYDYDDTDDSARLVDWFQTRLIQDNTHPRNVAYQELYGNRKLHKTRLQFDWSARSGDIFKEADSSNPFTISTSPIIEHRLVRKIQNAKNDQIKNVPVHRLPVIHKSSNGSTPPSSVEQIPEVRTPKLAKELSQNENDSFSTTSTVVVSWGINEAKNLTSKIISQSGSSDPIESTHVVGQRETGLFDNKMVSRFFGGTSHETPSFIGQFIHQSMLSTSSQPMSKSRVRFLSSSLPNSVSVHNVTPLKQLKDVRSNQVTKSAKTNDEFDEGNSFTFDQAPSIIVAKWQESPGNAKRQVIKTAAASASLRVMKRARKGLHLSATTERGPSSSERAVNDSREMKFSQLNKTMTKNSRLDEEIIKDAKLSENSGNKSHPNKEIKSPQRNDMGLKYKSSDSRTQVLSSVVLNDKPEDVTDSTNKRKLENDVHLEENEHQSESDFNNSEIMSSDFTNRPSTINKKIPTPLTTYSTLTHAGKLLDLIFDTVTLRTVELNISEKMETSLSNVKETTDLITGENGERNKDENAQKEPTTKTGLTIATEQNDFGSGDVHTEFDDISNSSKQSPYLLVGPIMTLGMSSGNINSSDLAEEETTDSSFKTSRLPDQSFNYDLHHEIPSLAGDHQTTATPFANQTEFLYISLTNFVDRASLQQDSGSDIETGLSPRTASEMNVLTSSFNEILNENRESVLKIEQRNKEKHLSKSGINVGQISTENVLNPTVNARHDVSHSYTLDKSPSRTVANALSPTSTESRDQHWQTTKIHEEASNGLKTTGYYVINKIPINSVASRRERNIKKTYGKKEKRRSQETKEETKDGNESIVLKENGLRNNEDSIKEQHPTQVLESDSSKNRYFPRQMQVQRDKENGVSKLSDGEQMSEDQDYTNTKINTQTRVWQKNSGNKTDFLYGRRYLTTASSSEEVNKKPDENSHFSNNEETNKQLLSLRQFVNQTISKRNESNLVARKLATELVDNKRKRVFILPKSMFTTVKNETKVEISSTLSDRNSQIDITELERLNTTSNELIDKMASILSSLSGLENNLTTKYHLKETYAFSNTGVSTTERITINEGYTTEKENSNRSNYSKDFLQNRKREVVAPKQFDKKALKEKNYNSENGKATTGDFREETRSKTLSTITSYYENRTIEQKQISTITSPASIHIRLRNEKETSDARQNADLTIINSSVTQSYANGLEFAEKHSKSSRPESNSIGGETILIPTKESSITESKSTTYTPRQNVATSNLFSTEGSGERTSTELPWRQDLAKSKELRSEVKINMEDDTGNARKTPSTHASIQATMRDSKNPSTTTEDPGRQNVSLMSTRENPLTVELKPEISGKSLEYSPITHSSNNDFNYNNNNKGIRTKGITFASRITEGRYTKVNEKDLEEEANVDKDLTFESYEDRLDPSSSSVSRFSNTHSIFPGFSTTHFDLSPGADSSTGAESNSVPGTKEKVSTTQTPSSIERVELEASNQTDMLPSNPPKTSRRYKDKSDDHVVTTDSGTNTKNTMFDSLFTKWTADVQEITENDTHKDVPKTFQSMPFSKTTSIRNRVRVSLPFSQENQNSFSTTIKMKTSESIKAKGFSLASVKHKVTTDTRDKFEKSPNWITHTLSAFPVSPTGSLEGKVLTSTQKGTLPKWKTFPQNFEDLLRPSHRKPNTGPSRQAIPTTKTSLSYERNKVHPEIAARENPLSTWATTSVHFVPRRSTVYLKEKKLYRPSAASLPQQQPKWTNQVQTSKNITGGINNTQKATNRNILQDNPIKDGRGFQSILGIREAFEKYWPAILGSTFGALFLGAAILTSFMCKRRTRVRRRRIRVSSQDQCYSPQPPVSEYSSGSSLIGENCPVNETPAILDEIS